MGITFSGGGVGIYERSKSPFNVESEEFKLIAHYFRYRGDEYWTFADQVEEVRANPSPHLPQFLGLLPGYDNGLSAMNFVGAFCYLNLAHPTVQATDSDTEKECLMSNVNSRSVAFFEYVLVQLEYVAKLIGGGMRSKGRAHLFVVYLACASAKLAETLIRTKNKDYQLLPLTGFLSVVHTTFAAGPTKLVNTIGSIKNTAKGSKQEMEILWNPNVAGALDFLQSEIPDADAKQALKTNYLDARSYYLPKYSPGMERGVKQLKSIADCFLALAMRSARSARSHFAQAEDLNLDVHVTERELLANTPQIPYLLQASRGLIDLILPYDSNLPYKYKTKVLQNLVTPVGKSRNEFTCPNNHTQKEALQAIMGYFKNGTSGEDISIFQLKHFPMWIRYKPEGFDHAFFTLAERNIVSDDEALADAKKLFEDNSLENLFTAVDMVLESQ